MVSSLLPPLPSLDVHDKVLKVLDRRDNDRRCNLPVAGLERKVPFTSNLSFLSGRDDRLNPPSPEYVLLDKFCLLF